MPSTDEALLVVEGLSSHYGPIRARSDVSLAVRQGELVAIVKNVHLMQAKARLTGQGGAGGDAFDQSGQGGVGGFFFQG